MKLNPIAPNMTELELNDGRLVLVSYKTPVAVFVPGEGLAITEKKWSRTTSRHVSKWRQAQCPAANVSVKPQAYFDSLI